MPVSRLGVVVTITESEQSLGFNDPGQNQPPLDHVVERQLVEQTRDYLERPERDLRRRPWQTYIDADLGLRGYWYPVARSQDVVEEAPKTVKVLGEEILLVRKGEKLYGVEDRCLHRGARFSARPLSLSEDTLTCWYHTWTFDLDDGRIRCILNDPSSNLSGKPGIRAYKVEERKGLVFAYIGDGEPPALEDDLPPGFMDEDVTYHVAEPRIINANWRLALENSFDPGHHFIHNWSPLVMESGFPITFGYVAKKGQEHLMVTYHADGPGPKGFTRSTNEGEYMFEATIPGKDGRPDTLYKAPGAVGRSNEELEAQFRSMPTIKIGIWMPCVNSIENFPDPFSGFEWLVPVDETTTMCMTIGGKRCASPEEELAWQGEQGHVEWKIPTVDKFIVDDDFAREGIQQFYEEEDGWYRERMYRPDVEITMLRKFFAANARGIQTRQQATGSSRRAGSQPTSENK
jgi:carbazole 1,9a-dioxygenase terminal dioxygenase component